MRDTLKALTAVLDSLGMLYRALGPGWTAFYVVLGTATTVAVIVWRDREKVRAWERLIDAKDAQIAQVNEQHRELRVQALVLGGSVSKDDAIELVYGKSRAAGGSKKE